MPDGLTIVKSWDAPEPDAKPSPFGARTATAEESRMLDEIKRRESSNNYAAKNRDSTASGAYQFINSTWRLASHETKAPYYATAAEAPPEVQDQNALHMLRKYGPNATITWAESGPYGTGKSRTSRNATAPAQASAAPTGNASADDLIARLAGGENVEITPQVIAQIIQGPKTEPAKPAAEPAPLTIVKSWDAPPPAKPPEPSPLSKTATAFMEGSKPLIDMMSLIQAGHDPVSAIQAGQTVKDIALTLWNERGRWWREVKQAVQSAQRGDVAATQQHTAGAIPLLGPGIQQIQQDIRGGGPAAAVGHGRGAGGAADRRRGNGSLGAQRRSRHRSRYHGCARCGAWRVCRSYRSIIDQDQGNPHRTTRSVHRLHCGRWCDRRQDRRWPSRHRGGRSHRRCNADCARCSQGSAESAGRGYRGRSCRRASRTGRRSPHGATDGTRVRNDGCGRSGRQNSGAGTFADHSGPLGKGAERRRHPKRPTEPTIADGKDHTGPRRPADTRGLRGAAPGLRAAHHGQHAGPGRRIFAPEARCPDSGAAAG